MKNFPHIADKLFNQPWLIRSSMHGTIARQFLAHINGEKNMDLLPLADEPDLAPEAQTESATPSLQVIPVFGVLGQHLGLIESICGGYDVNMLSAQLKEARDNPNVSAILLYINSPGGTVTGIPECAALIAEIDQVKPVYCFTDSQLCSGAYYLASQCRAILAAPSSDIGSIGVYMILLDETKALADEGIKVNAITAGKYKIAGAPFQPLSDDERAMFQADVDRIYSQFKSAVTSKRDIKDDYMQGNVFDGETAVTNNLADGLANDLDEAMEAISATLETPKLTG